MRRGERIKSLGLTWDEVAGITDSPAFQLDAQERIDIKNDSALFDAWIEHLAAHKKIKNGFWWKVNLKG